MNDKPDNPSSKEPRLEDRDVDALIRNFGRAPSRQSKENLRKLFEQERDNIIAKSNEKKRRTRRNR